MPMLAQDLNIELPTIVDFFDEIVELESKDFDLAMKFIKEQRPKTFNYKPPMNVGVGQYIKSLILEGQTNTAILAQVKEHYANNNTTYACVAWYRNDLRKKGQLDAPIVEEPNVEVKPTKKPRTKK